MRILLTGNKGFIGTHVGGALLNQGHTLCVPHIPDLRKQAEARRLIERSTPEIVIHLACPTPGGIGAMAAKPTICADMARIDANVIEACADFDVQQVIAIGSVCSFPEKAPLPATELDLWNGPMEPTNAPYGEGKRFLWTLLDAFRKERGLQSTYLVLTNVYGPGDTSEHVIPATIRKVRDAIASGDDHVTAWGDGSATRDFIYIDDVVSGILAAIGKPHTNPILLCAEKETKMWTLVERLAGLLDFHGEIAWDATQPSGQPRRAFRSLGKTALGWEPKTDIGTGLGRTVQWWKETQCSR